MGSNETHERKEMTSNSHDFVNELGNRIKMKVRSDEQGVTVFAEGPTSEVEHTWTRMEAEELMSLLESTLLQTETQKS
jgi:hypothetical protein